MTVRRTLEAALWLLVARANLSFRPRLALAPRSHAPRPGRLSHETGAQFVLAVRRASRCLPFRPTCLEQALALERLLRNTGLDASVVLGVRRVGATIEAHAWLEHQDQTLLGAPPAGLYTPFHRTGHA